jgi:hypothetical protein
MRGHVKVTKIYDTHREVVVDDNNLLVDGFGAEIVDVLTGNSDKLPYKMRPYYLQVGDSSIGYTSISNDTSTVFYKLSSPFTLSDYGDSTNLEIDNLYRSILASSTDPEAASPVYEEMLFTSAPVSAIEVSSTKTKEWFGVINPDYKTKLFMETFEVRMKFSRETLAGKQIKEFGLFSKNPYGYKDDRPFLLAYKSISAGFTKTSDFELLLEWSIGFLNNSKVYDRLHKG